MNSCSGTTAVDRSERERGYYAGRRGWCSGPESPESERNTQVGECGAPQQQGFREGGERAKRHADQQRLPASSRATGAV